MAYIEKIKTDFPMFTREITNEHGVFEYSDSFRNPFLEKINNMVPRTRLFLYSIKGTWLFSITTKINDNGRADTFAHKAKGFLEKHHL